MARTTNLKENIDRQPQRCMESNSEQMIRIIIIGVLATLLAWFLEHQKMK